MNISCAIHQPNFFPWLGYFDKIKEADVFVFLDRADYPKSGKSMGSWVNRVKINISGSAKWISCPVIREHGPQPIDTVKINKNRDWKKEFLDIIEDNYLNSTNFDNTYKLLSNILSEDIELLADFNIHAIKSISNELSLNTKWMKETDLPSNHKLATDRLISICQEVGASSYICGGGSAGYLEEGLFETAGISLTYQNFIAKPYGQDEKFIPGLSVIDYLMNTINT